MYSAGLAMFESMSTAVHSGTVTPVVSWPTERVMVLSWFLIARRTLSSDFSFSSSPAASTTS